MEVNQADQANKKETEGGPSDFRIQAFAMSVIKGTRHIPAIGANGSGLPLDPLNEVLHKP
jgi:hypothetical protein